VSRLKPDEGGDEVQVTSGPVVEIDGAILDRFADSLNVVHQGERSTSPLDDGCDGFVGV